MTELNQYLQDGANRQARAVMCLLQGLNIQDSWNEKYRWYDAIPSIARWENCREQGYVITLRVASRMLNIAFFEHRNSDSICAIKWEQLGINSPTIETAKMEGQCYKDKWDVSKQVGCEQIAEMADWIRTELENFYAVVAAKNKREGAAV